MIKILLILALCLPLGLVASHECWRLLDDWRSPPDVGDDDPSPSEDEKAELAKAEKDAKKAEKDAKEVLTPSETLGGQFPADLVRLAVALDDPPDSLDDPDLKGAVAKTVSKMGRERKDRRRTVQEAQVEATELAQKIEADLVKLRGEDGRPRTDPEENLLTGLKENLKNYNKLSVFDADLYASASAELDWPTLDRKYPRRELDKWYENIDRWTPQRTVATSFDPNAAEDRANKYKGYLDKHDKAKGNYAPALVREARERYELWRRAGDLVTHINDWSDKGPKRAEANRIRAVADANRIRAVAELASTDNPPERFIATARRVARLLCADLVPDEELDANVVLNDGGVPRPIARSLLRIRWKDRSPGVTLKESKFNEFTLNLDDVEDFVIGSESLLKVGPDPLSPTEYSKAVYDYNNERARIKRWSGEDVARLQDVYVRHRDQLDRGPNDSGKSLKVRLEALLDVVQRYPGLFSIDSN